MEKIVPPLVVDAMPGGPIRNIAESRVRNFFVEELVKRLGEQVRPELNKQSTLTLYMRYTWHLAREGVDYHDIIANLREKKLLF